MSGEIEIEMPPLEPYTEETSDTRRSETLTEEHECTPSTAYLLAEQAAERKDWDAHKGWLQYYDRQLRAKCRALLTGLGPLK